MNEFSNIEEVVSGLHDLGAALGLDDQGLADELADAYTGMLHDRASSQSGPDGVGWADNQADYSRRKGYLPVGIGITGEMLDPGNLKVSASIQGDQLVFEHAGTETSQQHLKWFEAGGRQLWGVDAETEARFHAIINRYIGEKVRDVS